MASWATYERPRITGGVESVYGLYSECFRGFPLSLWGFDEGTCGWNVPLMLLWFAS